MTKKDSPHFVLLTDDLSKELTEEIMEELEKKPKHLLYAMEMVKCKPFDDGDRYTKILKTTVRSMAEKDVFIIKQASHEVNHTREVESLAKELKQCTNKDLETKLIEFAHRIENPVTSMHDLHLIENALVKSDVKKFSIILPYWPEMRSDRKDSSGVPVASKLSSDQMVNAGSNLMKRFLTFDMHVPQQQSYFNIATDNLLTEPLFAWYLKKTYLKDYYKSKSQRKKFIVGAIDEGSVKIAKKFADHLGLDYTYHNKSRGVHTIEGGEAVSEGIIGPPVKDKVVILLDDIFGSGGTTESAYNAFKKEGARGVIGCYTHFIGNPKFDADGNLLRRAEDRLNKDDLQIITTNTLKHSSSYLRDNQIIELSVSPILAEVIYRKMKGDSISRVYDEKKTMELIFDRAEKAPWMCKEYKLESLLK